MGYPMTYRRVVARNQLHGDYSTDRSNIHEVAASFVAGDLRRLETDQRDKRHLTEYAKRTGLSKPKVKAVLDAFFEGDF